MGNDYLPNQEKRLAAAHRYTQARSAQLSENAEVEVKAPKAPRAPAVLKKIEGGPKKFFVGKKLTATTNTNPRREGVPGAVSFQLILDNPGIPFGEFIERGGRIQDVAWDYERGRVDVEIDGSVPPEEAAPTEEENVEA